MPRGIEKGNALAEIARWNIAAVRPLMGAALMVTTRAPVAILRGQPTTIHETPPGERIARKNLPRALRPKDTPRRAARAISLRIHPPGSGGGILAAKTGRISHEGIFPPIATATTTDQAATLLKKVIPNQDAARAESRNLVLPAGGPPIRATSKVSQETLGISHKMRPARHGLTNVWRLLQAVL